MADLEAIVHQVVLETAQQTSPAVTEINDDDALTGELGLESLDLAQIVATLEARTGLDPFAELVAITGVRTYRDLVAAYRRARDGAPPEDAAAVAESQNRARARRRAMRGRARA